MNGYTSESDNFNSYERYYSDEDDDDDEEDDEYGCVAGSANENNQTVEHNYDDSYAEDAIGNQFGFSYSNVSDGDIMKFLRTRSKYAKDNNSPNIGKYFDVRILSFSE